MRWRNVLWHKARKHVARHSTPITGFECSCFHLDVGISWSVLFHSLYLCVCYSLLFCWFSTSGFSFFVFETTCKMAWQELWNRWYPCWRENLKSAGYCAWQKCCRTDICQLTVTYHVCPHRFHSCMFESEWTSFLGLFHFYSLLMCFLCLLFVALQTFFKNVGEQVSSVHNFMMICPMCCVFGSARLGHWALWVAERISRRLLTSIDVAWMWHCRKKAASSWCLSTAERSDLAI